MVQISHLLIGIVAVCAVFFIYCKLQSASLAIRDRTGRVGDPVQMPPELVGVAPAQLKKTLVYDNTGGVHFPSNPVMPDMKVIDGIAPTNPDIHEKEWAVSIEPEETTDMPNISISTTTSPSSNPVFAPTYQVTPAPKRVPVPTMFPSPSHPEVTKEKRFQGATDVLHVDNPVEIDMAKFARPIDSVMSKWTQWGPCSADGKQERTRTCIHDGIDGGRPCGTTREIRSC